MLQTTKELCELICSVLSVSANTSATTESRTKHLQEERRSRQHFSRYSGSKWHHWHRMEVESLRPSLFLSLSSDLRISDVFPDSDADLGSGCYWHVSQTANIADERERRGQGHVDEEAPGRILIHEEVVQEEPPAAWGHTQLELCVYVCVCPAWEAEKQFWPEVSTRCPCAYLSSTISCLSMLPAPPGPPPPKPSQIERWPCMFPSERFLVFRAIRWIVLAVKNCHFVQLSFDAIRT